MCDICHCVPCRARCPNAERKTIGQCAKCKCDIENDTYYCVDESENLFCCIECALDFYGIKEI